MEPQQIPDADDYFGEFPEAWPDFHICRDFLDPLADEVGRWDADSLRRIGNGTAVEHDVNALPALEQLRRKLDLLEVSGRCVFGELAEQWFEERSPEAGRKFDSKVAALVAECESLQNTVKALDPTSEEWRYAFLSFDMNTVQPFVMYLRAKAVILRQMFTAEVEHERRLRGLVATYDADESRPTVSDTTDTGRILRRSHDCEASMVALLSYLFDLEARKELDESAVVKTFESLCDASDWLDGR